MNINQLLLNSTDSLSKEQVRNYLRNATLLVGRRIKGRIFDVTSSPESIKKNKSNETYCLFLIYVTHKKRD